MIFSAAGVRSSVDTDNRRDEAARMERWEPKTAGDATWLCALIPVPVPVPTAVPKAMSATSTTSIPSLF